MLVEGYQSFGYSRKLGLLERSRLLEVILEFDTECLLRELFSAAALSGNKTTSATV
jgi:hypothetical protein